MKETIFYPLTNPQKSVWYTEKLNPNTSIGSICATLKINRPLDHHRMEEAVNILLRRNASFRLRVEEVGGEPRQFFLDDISQYDLDYLDFSSEGTERLFAWDQEQSRIVIPVHNQALYYFALIKVDKNSCAFFARVHHIISDAWSLVQIANEVLEYYVALEQNLPVPLESNPSYLEYILKEEAYKKSKKYVADQMFWQEKFSIMPELTTLKSRVSQGNELRSVRSSFVLPERLSQQIREFCSTEKISIFALFYAALCIYINRIKGKEDITIGVPVLNRTNPREKRTMGMFISTVPLSITINDEMNFLDFLSEVKRVWMPVLKHQAYPYESILRDVRDKHKDVEKLYDIAISYQNAKMIKVHHDFTHEARWHANGYQMESLYIHINDREDDGQIILNYDFIEELFYQKEIEFIHDHIMRLLWHALDNPKRALYKIHMLSETEARKVIQEFNDSEINYPHNGTIHGIFEQCVEKYPQATALVYQDRSITYEELNIMANRIAHALLQKGVQREDIVVLLFDRTPDMIAGILGVLKAGGAYLPVDPDYPSERMQTILTDSQAGFLLTNQKYSLPDLCILSLAEDDLHSYSQENPSLDIDAHQLAYIIYTSGSTGVPKGVMIEHRHVLALVLNPKLEMKFGQEDVWIGFHSYCFDVSVWEMFASLLHGSRLVVADKETIRDPELFLDELIKNRVTVLCQIPISFYNLMRIEERSEARELSLRYVIFAGESLKAFMLKSFHQRYPDVALINMYGVTEATVYQTYKRIDTQDLLSSNDNIGKPLPGDIIFILDKNMQPSPIGTMGEMFIGGAGVARGYLNRQELTSEKFVKSPLAPDTYLYRSGDYARWFPEGEIEYLGRIDHQVKIRGHRIELGEIEKKILSYPGIAKAVVIAKEDELNKKSLCAYFVANEGVRVPELKDHLVMELPSYMIPSYFMLMEKLPLTSTGKVDVQALPEPEAQLMKQYVAPETSNQRIIAEIWQEILDVDRVGMEDSFFDLGGDSLSAVQFASYLYSYGMRIEMQDIYRYPTIKMLSNRITDMHDVNEQSEKMQSEQDAMMEGQDLKQSARSIMERIIIHDLPKLDAAALTYIPEDFLMLNRKSKQEVIHEVFQDEPVLYHRIANEHGSIGVFALPIINSDLYSDRPRLLEKSKNAILMAERLGARVVSLTGLIPSATSYGRDLQAIMSGERSQIQITTGHTTTVASVILSLQRLLDDSGRNIINERVAVLGLGSIGSLAIKLLLRIGLMPRSIVLCDIEEKEPYLQQLKSQLMNQFGYSGSIEIYCANPTSLPGSFYAATLIIGATNVPDVLDVGQLGQGTLIIDDSGPHCFAKDKAIARLMASKDILFTEGGVLESPGLMSKMTYFPKQMTAAFKDKYHQNFKSSPDITGCILSGLLSVNHSLLKPTLGEVDVEDAYLHYRTLIELGYKGAHLHCDDFTIDQSWIDDFRNRYQA